MIRKRSAPPASHSFGKIPRPLAIRNLVFACTLLLFIPLSARAQTYAWKNVKVSGAGAMVTGVVAHPLQAGLVYIRTDVGGSYRWDAAGSKWIPLNDNLTFALSDDYCCEALSIDPNNVNVVYYAGGLANYGRNGAIFKSTNQGATWTQLTGISLYMDGNGDRRWAGERLAVSPSNSNVILFGSRKNGLWRSADGGTTWAQAASIPVAANSYGVQSVVFDPGSPGKAYAFVSGGAAYVSTNDGASWTSIGGSNIMRMKVSSNGTLWCTTFTGVSKYSGSTWTNYTPAGSPSRFCALGINPSNPNDILVAREQASSNSSIYRTTNGGSTWTQQTYTVSSTATWATPALHNYRPTDFVFDPYNTNTVWGDRWRTTNINASTVAWVQQEEGHEEDVCGAAIAPPSGYELLVGVFDDDGFAMNNGLDAYPTRQLGIVNSWNGHTWGMAYQETNPLNMIRLGTQPFYGGTLSPVSKSTDGGNTWNRMTTFPSNLFPLACAISATNPLRMVVICNANYSSDNSGGSWVPVPATNPWRYTIDGGTTWSVISGLPTPPSSYGPWGNNQFLATDHVNGSKVYYLDVDSATNTTTGRIYRSVNSGAAFTQVNPTSLLPAGKRSFQLKSRLGVEGDLWASVDNYPSSHRTSDEGLYRSTNSGVTWTKVASVNRAFSFGFGKAPTGSPTATLYLYGRTNGAMEDTIYQSLDLGLTWTNIQAPNNRLSDFPSIIEGSRQTFGRVFVGTGGRGFFYNTPSSSTLSGSVAAPPATINLTSAGTVDWGQWGLNNYFNHKATGFHISNVSYVGTGIASWNTGEAVTFTWTDGTPTASASSTAVKNYRGLNAGLQLTVPADTTPRTLKVYVKGYKNIGAFSAHLSDNSSPDYTNSSQSSQTGTYYAVYTLHYAAATAGQTLTVKWISTTDYSGSNACNAGIQAATLTEG